VFDFEEGLGVLLQPLNPITAKMNAAEITRKWFTKRLEYGFSFMDVDSRK
jgi:hypothetical protein